MTATATPSRGVTVPPHMPAPFAPVTSLTVLYDARCPLCRRVREWLDHQPKHVPMEFVAAGSAEAAARFPKLDPAQTLREITVVAQDGRVWTGDGAWIACLWATMEHRAKAAALAGPAARPLARQVVAAVSALRPIDDSEPGGNCDDGCDARGAGPGGFATPSG